MQANPTWKTLSDYAYLCSKAYSSPYTLARGFGRGMRKFGCARGRHATSPARDMEWSNEKTIEFVEDYRNFPCLWKVSDPDYKNRTERRDAQQYLADKYELDTRKAVNNKIKSLRSYFHKLHTEAEKRSSEPSWFLYKNLYTIILAGEDYKEEEGNSQEDLDNQTEKTSDSTSSAFVHETVVNKRKIIEDEASKARGGKKKSNDIGKWKKFDNSGTKGHNIGQAEEAVSILGTVTQNAKKKDYITSFAEYVEGRIRNFSDARLQSLAQWRIQSVLFELETGESVPHMDMRSCPSKCTQSPCYCAALCTCRTKRAPATATETSSLDNLPEN